VTVPLQRNDIRGEDIAAILCLAGTFYLWEGYSIGEVSMLF